jgi:hypothetical protein
MTRLSRTFIVVLAGLFAAIFAGVAARGASASPPVRGSFTVGSLASFDELAKFIKGSDVSCSWSGKHVVVRLVLTNRSVESIKATIKPRYYIARGSEHGSGFTSSRDFTLRGGQRRTVSIDAGSPEGTPTGARIGRCAPYLYLVDHP